MTARSLLSMRPKRFPRPMSASKISSSPLKSSSPRLLSSLSPSTLPKSETIVNLPAPFSVSNYVSLYRGHTPPTRDARLFSSSATTSPGKLDISILQKIEAELKEVDINKDGRLDTEELKQLFHKHSSAFSEEEIMEFGDLYYAGKGGGSVPIQEFLAKLMTVEGADKVHPILDGNCSTEYIYRKTHDSYTEEELDIELTHKPPETLSDKMALQSVKVVRFLFDFATGWNNDTKTITQEMVLNRVIFLETIAAVPGMVAAIVRHFKSLRKMERDGGLMHVFLEEANNERMHLLSFIKMKNPDVFFRGAVIVSQFGFGSAFLMSYMASPKFCHRFVGYVEEEACTTYTKIIKAIQTAPEGSELAPWKTEIAPSIARGYWKLGEDGTVLDLMYAVRADEAEHRDVNHACSELEHSQQNPFNDPELKINQMLRKYLNDIMTRN